MDVFVCAGCEAPLSAPVFRVALPVHAHHSSWHELLPPLMEQGTYAVDPLPSGPPYRRRQEIEEDEAAARGVYAPEYSVSFGAAGRIALAPGDSRGTVLIPERCDGYCVGLDGRDGPNLACERCASAVGTRVDDCGMWQAVWLEPGAVRRVASVGGPAPVDPVPGVRPRPPVEPGGGWDGRWVAAVAVALAHLVVAAEGDPVTFPAGGLLAETFARGADAVLPTGPVRKSVGLAGPGVPVSGHDIALVPRDPVTGEPWRPSADVPVAPLSAEVWAYLAEPPETSPLPASGTLPPGVLRDDYPLPPHPAYTFEMDRRIFLHTLARHPAVRRPRIRAVYDRVLAGRNQLWL